MDEHATAASKELRYLDPEDVRVWQGEDGRTYCTIADELTVITPVFVRAQPLSDPDRYVSIRGADPKDNAPRKGREFGLLRKWRRLDHDSLRIVGSELERRYLHARVMSICSVKDYSGVQVCVFDTDRGLREVTLRDVRDNVVYVGASRVLITDAEG
ncbi:MAG: DUF1854 domain-containing protein, partial [Armatimonadetes bacterium]|nr:DUF1854 domain-containing protein [Armatimonadota bacterium]